MTSTRSQQRRIALQTAGSVHDLALPGEEALGDALLALGLMPAHRERILDAAGRVVHLDTRAEQLREGGLYSIAAPPRPGAGRLETDREGRIAVAPWLVLATALLALAAGILPELRTATHGSGPWLVGLGAVSILALAGWGRNRGSAPYVWVPVVVLTGVAFTLMWRIDASQPTSALAAGMAAAAVGGAFITLAGASPETRAIGGPIMVISAVVAIVLLTAPMLQWSLLQVGGVVGAMAAVGLRAVPSWVITVDDGHHVDYARFAQVRWSVRGQMPEYLPHVDLAQVRERVRVLEARLRVATGYLSVLLAGGVWVLATFFFAPTAAQRIAAMIAVALVVLGALLVSRRTIAVELRTPPRIAAAVGLIGAGVITGMNLEALAGSPGVIVSAGLLVAAGVMAGIALAITRGARSILWSRVGDIVEGAAVAFVLPAALVAVGTIDVLRGVFSG